jgi:hypothetical protein
MNGWVATHTVTTATASMWATPDPANAPTAALSPGQAVSVVAQRGGWSEVVLLDGTRGWVDTSALAPVAAPRSRGRGPLVVVALLGVAAIAVAAFLLTRDDGKKPNTQIATPAGGSIQSGASSAAGNGLVRFNAPPGWFVSDDGLVLAESKDDLDATDPKGPQVRALLGQNDADDPTAIMNAAQQNPSFDLVETPTDIEVSGIAAIRVTIRQGDSMSQFVAVHAPGKDAVVFVVECPVDRFDELRGDLEDAPGLKL